MIEENNKLQEALSEYQFKELDKEAFNQWLMKQLLLQQESLEQLKQAINQIGESLHELPKNN